MGKIKQFIDVAANVYDSLQIYKLLGDELEQDFLKKTASITQTPTATLIHGDSLPILESSKIPSTPRKINWGSVDVVSGFVTAIGNIPIGTVGSIQNIWETVTGDTGSSTATGPNDSLSVIGGGIITTSISSGVLTITAGGGASQDAFLTFNGDNGSKSAVGAFDFLDILGTGGIETTIDGDVLTIHGAGIPGQYIWKTIAADIGVTSATSPSTVLQVSGVNGISTEMVGNNLIIDGAGASDVRLKENISTPTVQWTDSVKLYSFNMKGEARIRYGVIAQELEKKAPDMVITHEFTGMKSVLYTDFLIAKVARLEERVLMLENKE